MQVWSDLAFAEKQANSSSRFFFYYSSIVATRGIFISQ